MSSSDSIDPLGLYAAAMDTSDYVDAVVPAVRGMAPPFASLLDVGAGGGQLGHALRNDQTSWTAVEPSSLMRQRLARFQPSPTIVASAWQDADLAPAGHDLVFAATMPALFDHPESFLDRCQAWARQAVIWVVPAQNGPKGLIFAGCLPRAWHGEDETPGIERTLRGLPLNRHPQHTVWVEWTFSAVIPEIAPVAAFLADRLHWSKGDPRRPELQAHLERQAQADPAGYRLEIPRKSAIMMWSVRK